MSHIQMTTHTLERICKVRRPARYSARRCLEKNLEIVRRAIKAFNREDLDQALEWADPEIEWVVARDHPDAATHRGRDAVAAYLREWQTPWKTCGSRWPASWRWETPS